MRGGLAGSGRAVQVSGERAEADEGEMRVRRGVADVPRARQPGAPQMMRGKRGATVRSG
jgi:hypothetical protein